MAYTDDDLNDARTWAKARRLTVSATMAWREAVLKRADHWAPTRIVDIGCGAGRYSGLLARWFGVPVIGVLLFQQP